MHQTVTPLVIQFSASYRIRGLSGSSAEYAAVRETYYTYLRMT